LFVDAETTSNVLNRQDAKSAKEDKTRKPEPNPMTGNTASSFELQHAFKK